MLHAIASHLKKIDILADDVKNKEADLVKHFTHVKLCFLLAKTGEDNTHAYFCFLFYWIRSGFDLNFSLMYFMSQIKDNCQVKLLFFLKMLVKCFQRM